MIAKFLVRGVSVGKATGAPAADKQPRAQLSPHSGENSVVMIAPSPQ